MILIYIALGFSIGIIFSWSIISIELLYKKWDEESTAYYKKLEEERNRKLKMQIRAEINSIGICDKFEKINIKLNELCDEIYNKRRKNNE
jgi:hypothetical protein